MNQNKLKIGLVAARPNSEKEEIKKFSQNKKSDTLLFPEGFLISDNLSFAQGIARENKKWIISGMDDKREKEKKIKNYAIAFFRRD